MTNIIDEIRHELQTLVRRYRRWMMQPKLFVEVITIITIITILSAGWSFGELGAIMGRTELTAENYAQAVEQAPDVWSDLAQKARKNNEISEYEYRLEIQRIQVLRSRTPELAARIRELGGEDFVKESVDWGAKQFVQLVTGEVAGKVAGRFVGKAAEESNEAVNALLHTSYGISSRVAFGDPQSKLSKEWQEIFNIIKEAKGKDPEQLMLANFHYKIRYMQLHADELTDEEYEERLRSHAMDYHALTKAGGSPTSMWKDEEELAKWLASKAGRKLPEVKEEEETPITITIPSGVHHLGDQTFTDWEVPKPEGTEYTTTFSLATEPATSADLTLNVFQTDYDNPVLVNGKKVGFLCINRYKSWEQCTISIPKSALNKIGSNTLTIRAGRIGTNYDDFMIKP